MLYIFVEGPDDYNFFEKLFGQSWGEHQIIQYACEKDSKINSYIRSINSVPGWDYLFFCDEDGKGFVHKRTELHAKYDELDLDKLLFVQYEIESWYYAGVNRDDCNRLKIRFIQGDTNRLTKEQFNAKLKRLSDRKYVMAKILECYNIELAATRNRTFDKFLEAIKEEPVAVS